MTILVLFVQYDTAKYPQAYERLEAYLAALPAIRWVVFRIDNARPFNCLESTGKDRYSLGGDNADWEFSGWRLGLEQAERAAPEYDGVLFVNDSFEVSEPSLLDGLSSFRLKLFMLLNMPLGNVDYLLKDETVLNIKIRKWIRTNCFILSGKTVKKLGNMVSVNEALLDTFIDKDYNGEYFKKNAEISQGLQRRIVAWLSREWHSRFIIENDWELFRNKTRAMLNEWLLGSRLYEISPVIIDNRLVSGKAVLRLLAHKMKNLLLESWQMAKACRNSLPLKIKNTVKSSAIAYSAYRLLRAKLKSMQAAMLDMLAFFESKIVLAKIAGKIGLKNVVFIEPNETHAEVLPGFAYYFLLLGYSVHVLMRRKCFEENPFVNMNNERLHIYKSGYRAAHIIYEKVGPEIDLVVITTSSVYADPVYDFLGTHPRLKKAKFGTVAVLHHIREFNSKSMGTLVQQSRIITLQAFPGFKNGCPLAPIYFGKVEKHQKNPVTKFVVVGGVEKSRRDYDLLFEAVDRLLAEGVENFSVTVIGLRYDFTIPERFQGFISAAGRVDFKKLYDYLNESDFILPLLNTNNHLHHEYGQVQTSGARQLSFGFLTPCVIENHFARRFGFSEFSAITYDNSVFPEALRKAIALNDREYDSLVENIAGQAEKIHGESLQNLKNMLERLEHGPD